MAKFKTKKVSVVSLIISLVLLLFLIAGVGFIAKYTNGFSQDFTLFYWQYIDDEGSHDVISDTESVVFSKSKEVKINVKYTLGGLMSNNDNAFSVNIIPIKSDTVDFKYSVDGVEMSYKDIVYDMAIFNYKPDNGSFTLTFDQSSITDIVTANYPGKHVVFPDGFIMANTNYLRLEVKSFNDMSVMGAGFSILDRIELQPGITVG